MAVALAALLMMVTLFVEGIPNLVEPEPKRVFTAENAETAEKNKLKNLCALCVLGG